MSSRRCPAAVSICYKSSDPWHWFIDHSLWPGARGLCESTVAIYQHSCWRPYVSKRYTGGQHAKFSAEQVQYWYLQYPTGQYLLLTEFYWIHFATVLQGTSSCSRRGNALVCWCWFAASQAAEKLDVKKTIQNSKVLDFLTSDWLNCLLFCMLESFRDSALRFFSTRMLCCPSLAWREFLDLIFAGSKILGNHHLRRFCLVAAISGATSLNPLGPVLYSVLIECRCEVYLYSWPLSGSLNEATTGPSIGLTPGPCNHLERCFRADPWPWCFHMFSREFLICLVPGWSCKWSLESLDIIWPKQVLRHGAS